MLRDKQAAKIFYAKEEIQVLGEFSFFVSWNIYLSNFGDFACKVSEVWGTSEYELLLNHLQVNDYLDPECELNRSKRRL